MNRYKGVGKLIFNLRLNSIVEEEIQQGITKPLHREERILELKRFYKLKRKKERAMIIEFKQQEKMKRGSTIGPWQKKFGPVM